MNNQIEETDDWFSDQEIKAIWHCAVQYVGSYVLGRNLANMSYRLGGRNFSMYELRTEGIRAALATLHPNKTKAEIESDIFIFDTVSDLLIDRMEYPNVFKPEPDSDSATTSQ